MRRTARPDAVLEWSPGHVRDAGSGELRSVEAVRGAGGLSGTVGVALARRLVFARLVHTPPVERAEAEAVVRLQLESLFPVPSAELAHDFVVRPARGPDGLPTGVYATRAESIREAEAEVRSAGMTPVWFVPAGWGAVMLLEQSGASEGVVVDRSGSDTTIDVVRDGLLEHSRTVPTDNDPARVAVELARTVAALSCSDLPVFACPGVETGNARPLRASTLEALAGFDGSLFALELPEARARRAAQAAASKRRFATLVWLAAAVLGTLAWLDRDEAASAARDRSAKYSAQIERLDNVERMVQEVRGRAEQVGALARAAQRPAQTPSDVLRYVAGSTPPKAWQTGLTFERGKPLQVRGMALDRDSVSAFADNLSASDRFRDVTIVYANEAEVEKQTVVQFSMTAHVVGNLPLIEKKPVARRRP